MPVRFLGGVSSATSTTTLGEFGALDPTKYHTYFNDFDTYTAADWTITTTEDGSSDATEALTDADGGVLLITNDNGDNDRDFFNKKGESFAFNVGKQTWFKSRFKVSNATQSDFVMGLQQTDNTPLVASNGVYFQKDDGDTNLDFRIQTGSTVSSSAIATTVVDDTYITVGFHFSGATWGSVVKYFVNDVHSGTLNVVAVPSTELTVSFGIQNGTTSARSMSLDYIFVAQER